MQNALQISHWLQTGVANLPQADRNKLRLLLTRYPCFLPLKALAAAVQESEEASAEAVYFSGLNPVLLQALKSRHSVAEIPVAEAVTEMGPQNDLPAPPVEAEKPDPKIEEEEILVHLPASEDTGEVNLTAELPVVAEIPAEEEKEDTEVPSLEIVPEEAPQLPEVTDAETPAAVAPEDPVEEALPEEPAAPESGEGEAGVLTHLPLSEDTGELNIPAVEVVEVVPPDTAASDSSTEIPEEGPELAVEESAEMAGLPEEPATEEAIPDSDKDFETSASENVPAAPSLSHATPLPVHASDSASTPQSTLPAGEEGRSVAEEEVIQPLYANDYFLHQGVANGEDTIPKSGAFAKQKGGSSDLMIMRSFAEWLRFFQSLKTEAGEEEAARRAVKASWQKERLAAALEEEEEEIPEVVFEMALTSIAPEGNMASEPLALIYAKQGKWEKAIEVYQRLQLRNPQKSAYFAEKIAVLQQQHRP
jgi:hypothetical protein